MHRDPELTVLFTERSQDLPDHPGQISFPGGRIEPGDADAAVAALREAEEEVALARDRVTLLGRLTESLRLYQRMLDFQRTLLGPLPADLAARLAALDPRRLAARDADESPRQREPRPAPATSPARVSPRRHEARVGLK